MKEKLLSFFKNRTHLLIATVLVGIIIIAVRLYLPVTVEHDISIPTPASSESAAGGIRRADVTKETVQTVLQTLSRAENYSRVYKVTTFWSGGKSQSTVSVWKKGNKIRIRSVQGGTTKNVLLAGKQLSVWYDGSGSVFHSELKDSGTQELDEFSRLVTYEGIFSVPAENILAASYGDHGGQNCIYAKYKSGNRNYVNQIYVSLQSGLLISAEIDDGETSVYKMESVSTDLTAPADSSFTVPG